MYQDTKVVRSLLWGQGINRFPVEQIIGNNSGVRVHASNATSRESLIELAICIRPDILIFDSAILGGEKSWYTLLSGLKGRMQELGLIAIINDLQAAVIQELARVQLDGIIKADKVHLELPNAIRAYQKSEVYLNPQVAKVLCSQLGEPNQTNYIQTNQDRGLLPTLTNREMEVLACLTRGLNYKEISKQLFVSSSTVKTHVNNIFTKLNLNDRTQAVLYGLKHGIEQMVPNLFIKEKLPAQTSTNFPLINQVNNKFELPNINNTYTNNNYPYPTTIPNNNINNPNYNRTPY